MPRLIVCSPAPVPIGPADGVVLAQIADVPVLLIAGGIVVVTLLLALYALRQLNRSHERLTRSLEAELAERRKAEQELRVSEEQLRRSEAFYHSLVESLPQSILRKDLDGRFTFGNSNFSAPLGRAPEEIRDRTDFDFYPEALARKYRADDLRVIETGKPFEAVEENVVHGERRYVQVIKTPLTDHEGRIVGVQGIFWDVTERKRAEDERKRAEEKLREQNERLQAMAESERRAHEELKRAQSRLVQAEKLSALGQMVAGVAHEINNPLAFVGNNVAVLQRDVGEMHELLSLYRRADAALEAADPALWEQVRAFRERVDMDYTLHNIQGLLNRTREGLNRIQQIVKDLRLFARLDESDLSDVDLNEGVASTINIIHGHAKKKRVQIEADLAPLPAVTCYPAKINQVVMNLLSNAIDACPEGGTVTVRTRADEDDGVRIEVLDDGPGIDPAIRDRIFDPFFTTKPVGIGTGLGLSISYGIVQDHGGAIDVDGAPGRGTRFTVRLPVRAAAAR